MLDNILLNILEYHFKNLFFCVSKFKILVVNSNTVMIDPCSTELASTERWRGAQWFRFGY